MAAMNMVSAGVSFHLRSCPQRGRFCTLQENPHFWVPTIKVRQPDGIPQIISKSYSESLHQSLYPEDLMQ